MAQIAPTHTRLGRMLTMQQVIVLSFPQILSCAILKSVSRLVEQETPLQDTGYRIARVHFVVLKCSFEEQKQFLLFHHFPKLLTMQDDLPEYLLHVHSCLCRKMFGLCIPGKVFILCKLILASNDSVNSSQDLTTFPFK